MEALQAPSPVLSPSLIRYRSFKHGSSLSFSPKNLNSPLICLTQFKKPKFKNLTAISSSVSTEPTSPIEKETENFDQDEQFDWFSQWYAVMPVCDLDKRAPCGKKVMGLDVVVWWDKNENAWKVFDDMCPHRLAPLSEGRIDQWGRLQCVYHGWCFSGSGDCKLIPQAPHDGPPVNSIACGLCFEHFIHVGKVAQKQPQQVLLIFICIPVSAGNSRLIFIFPRNFAVWIDRFVPRWIFHINQNLIIDSDLYLLHVEEKKLMEADPCDWQKLCFVPTKSDANVVAYRKWLKKYSGGQINWGNDFNRSLPPSPPREQLMDRYWSHVVNCSSCNAAYKGLNALEVSLQVFSVASVAIVAATKQAMISVAARNTLAVAAILCFVGSKWLSHFIYKNFRYHDYNHASQ
ncbi:hypothetical protein E3N88_01301 [Mikania micrantha]|uniref:Rieske domain-containing protein n=1 Tax=Mikania micrantha TaxID=192012 RepID=A0A5N6Q0L2_9ASTR|nr:hypothetical protein E3N88_01301 [Mikania micrantha]